MSIVCIASMGRVLFTTCLPMFMPKGSEKLVSPIIKHDILHGFCSSLSEGLHELGTSLVDGSISLHWSAEAMNLLKRMLERFLALVEELHVLESSEGGDWLDEYMRETLVLLDTCNVLKSSISSLERYRLLVDFTVTKMCDRHLVAIDKLGFEQYTQQTNADYVPLLDVPSKLLVHDATAKQVKPRKMNPVLHIFKCTIRIICALLITYMVAPISKSVTDVCNEFDMKLLQTESLVSSIRVLAAKMQKSEVLHENGWCLNMASSLIELEKVERQVTQVRAQIGEGREDQSAVIRAVGLLKLTCDDLEHGLELFDFAMKEVFEEVIKGRTRVMKLKFVQ